MPSPFPGMDPFLESQGFWQDFHPTLLVALRESLNDRLPPQYAALIEERVQLVDASGDVVRGFRPDVAVLERPRTGQSRSEESHTGVATVEPVALPLVWESFDEITERWIVIKRLPEKKLVTVIEVLSPTNKLPRGFEEYLSKRWEVLDQPVHLVEIDLLLQGRRIPFGRPLPAGDYYAYVTRTAQPRVTSDVYAWPLRHPLPTIPIPLSAPDPDIPLDLAAMVSRAYEQGRYGRLVDYSAELRAPLPPEDLRWAAEVSRPGS
ncbi:MAG: DUF4058 family protein [Isosphaeraceae bacterium]